MKQEKAETHLSNYIHHQVLANRLWANKNNRQSWYCAKKRGFSNSLLRRARVFQAKCCPLTLGQQLKHPSHDLSAYEATFCCFSSWTLNHFHQTHNNLEAESQLISAIVFNEKRGCFAFREMARLVPRDGREPCKCTYMNALIT